MIERFFQNVLNQHLPTTLLDKYQSVGGGCINNAARLTTNQGDFFLKWNLASEKELFETEVKGLSLLQNQKIVKTPEILGNGVKEGKAYLLLEWIEKGYLSTQFWDDFGNGLASLHQTTSDQFGLDHNNFIGRLSQSNTFHEKWNDFFINERLKPQLKLASDRKLIDEKINLQFDVLFNKLIQLIPPEPPALLHGDLWSGNFLVGTGSEPILIDPAVHYGHRETELSFTYLFGGFDEQFYAFYKEAYPLERGFEERIELHNLYPLLVHVNLFGTSYLTGITQTLKRFT